MTAKTTAHPQNTARAAAGLGGPSGVVDSSGAAHPQNDRPCDLRMTVKTAAHPQNDSQAAAGLGRPSEVVGFFVLRTLRMTAGTVAALRMTASTTTHPQNDSKNHCAPSEWQSRIDATSGCPGAGMARGTGAPSSGGDGFGPKFPGLRRVSVPSRGLTLAWGLLLNWPIDAPSPAVRPARENERREAARQPP